MGLSGGVDSSVAAWLLQTQGYNVVGITMEIYDHDFPLGLGGTHACYGPDELEDMKLAAAVCGQLGIPFHRVDLRAEYRRYVLEYFRETYLSGRTPNPCIVCNQRIKFGFLQAKAREAGLGFQYFATGHYARLKRNGTRTLLLRAADRAKDQSYFLYTLRPRQLEGLLFPLGELKKTEVRALARRAGLPSAERPESQDFIAGRNYTALFAPHEIRPGEIVDETGRVLGRHRGIVHYTVGQRQGLGISAAHPLYVTHIDAAANRIVVGPRERTLHRGLIAADLNLIAVESLAQPLRIQAKIRLQHRAAEAMLFARGPDKAYVRFDSPQAAVTPGQGVVFYQGEMVLGGGVIQESF